MIEVMDWVRLWVLQYLFCMAGCVFVHPMEKRDKFKLRVFWFTVIIVIYTLVFQLYLWDGNHMVERVARVVSFCLMICFLYTGWKTSFSMAVYNSIWATVLWQLLSELWSVIEFFGADYFNSQKHMTIIGMILLYIAGYAMATFTVGKWMAVDRKYNIGPRQTLSALVIFAIIEVLANSDELRHISEYSSEWKFLYVSQLLCVVILYMQNEMFKKSAIRENLAIMNLLWKNKQEQYELSKENITLINQKSHDLKHQIRALRKLNKEEFEKYLDEIEESVDIYEHIVKTGNDVFDTILTEKSLYCRKHEINITCVADGSQMDFIGTVDLYAILGNALDNAIEAVQKFHEPEMRQIDVQIYRQQNFLVMHFINPVRERLVYEEDELPATTKGDSKFHGFGLRSISHFVRKYEGHMNVRVEDGCFSLKIMMPVP